MILRLLASYLVLSSSILVQGVVGQTIVVEFDDADGEVFSEEAQSVITEIAQSTEVEVRSLLPRLPTEIRITVSSGPNVIPETGTGGSSLAPGHIGWTVDTSRPEGAVTIARTHLRSNLFHEMHHLVRGWLLTGGEPVSSFMDGVVSEGLATAFEREFAESRPLWGDYTDQVADWVDELLALPLSAYNSYQQWMFQHPDGRRWIGYRAGTYIADRAIAASGLSSAELVAVPTEEVLRLAGVR